MEIPREVRRFHLALSRVVAVAAERGRYVKQHSEFSDSQVDRWLNTMDLPGGEPLLTLCYQLGAPLRDAARLSRLRGKAASALPLPDDDADLPEPVLVYYNNRSIAEQEYVYQVGRLAETLAPEALSYSGVFISYRRDDEPHFAGRLQCHLSRDLGDDRVFLDVSGIEVGTSFVDALDSALDQSECVIAVIGLRWRQLLHRSETDADADYVRIEIKRSLDRDIETIPVLVDDADMPRHKDLPADISPLAGRHAVRISHESFESDYEILRSVIRDILNR